MRARRLTVGTLAHIRYRHLWPRATRSLLLKPEQARARLGCVQSTSQRSILLYASAHLSPLQLCEPDIGLARSRLQARHTIYTANYQERRPICCLKTVSEHLPPECVARRKLLARFTWNWLGLNGLDGDCQAVSRMLISRVYSELEGAR